MKNMKGDKKVARDVIFLIIIVMITLMLSFKYSILHVRGDSMFPTYQDKDVIFLNKQKEIETNDIAVFLSPESWRSGGNKFIKRILAKEGDLVHITNETLSVNGESVANITNKRCGLDTEEEFKVGKNKILMVGDNHSSSNDSLTQFCNGNEEFLIDESEVLFSGKEIYVLSGGLIQW